MSNILITGRGNKVHSRSQRRYIAIVEYVDSEKGTESVVIEKRSDSLATLRTHIRLRGVCNGPLFVQRSIRSILDTRTGEVVK